MSCIIALDQSTSATKALLFDESGLCLDRGSLEHQQHYPRPGWVEHDAEEIWQNALAVLRTLLGRQTARRPDLRGLSITNQRETVVIFDRATGQPLGPAIVWQCRRGDAICAAHAQAGREPLIRARTGLRLDAYFSGSKLQWLVQNRPDLRAKLSAGDALIGTIDTYLIYRLTNGRVFATDATNASRTLLYDISRLQWDDELCALWKVSRAALAEVRESTARFGETTLGGALDRPLAICGVMGDSQASLFAQRCFEPGMAKVTFGTGSSVMLNIGPTWRVSAQGVITALAWVIGGKPTYALEGIIISSAATLNWLQDQLGLFKDTREIETLAAQLTDTDGVHLVPAFSGLGLPHWSASARAALCGLSGHSDRRHVARAALESMAFQLHDALEAMQAGSGITVRSLQADGGPTANRLLMQLTADLTGVKLHACSTVDCSALGAAFAGLIGLGMHASLPALAALPHREIIYQPTLPAAALQARRAGWHHAVRQVLLPSTALPTP